MNLQEKYMLKWIVKETGVPQEEIYFSNNSSPDFILPDKRGFEVKRLINKRDFTIDIRQWVSLLEVDDCKILLCDKSGKLVDVLNVIDIPYMQRCFAEYVIYWTDQRRDQRWRSEYLEAKRAGLIRNP